MSPYKVLFFLLVLFLAILSAVFINPDKVVDQALSTVCTIFSVLAGLLLAIYALHISSVESTDKLSDGTYKSLVWDSRKAVLRLSYYFWLYLIALTFSLAVIIARSLDVDSMMLIELADIITRIAVFSSVLAIGLSFLVPLELKYIQERKILEAKEKAKQK